jgi:hypothetical protein
MQGAGCVRERLIFERGLVIGQEGDRAIASLLWVPVLLDAHAESRSPVSD